MSCMSATVGVSDAVTRSDETEGYQLCRHRVENAGLWKAQR